MDTHEALRHELAVLLDANHGLPHKSGKAHASLCNIEWVQEAITLLQHEDQQLVQLLAQQMIQGEDEIQVREYAFFLPRINCKDQRRAMTLTQTVRLSTLPLSRDYANEPQRVQEQCIAMINVVDALDEITRGRTSKLTYYTPTYSTITSRHTLIPILTDHEFLDTIVEDPAAANQLADLVHETQTTDYRTLHAILNGIAPSLATGHL